MCEVGGVCGVGVGAVLIFIVPKYIVAKYSLLFFCFQYKWLLNCTIVYKKIV